MTTSTTIAELERQREERHRLLDQEYDQRIATIRKTCKHETTKWYNMMGKYVGDSNTCKHCGAYMRTQST